MNWLLTPPIRPCIALAALASLLLNLALLAPALYMLQVFDRVFASRSLETLLALSAFAALALLLAGCMDRARALLLARAGRTLDETLAPLALETLLADAAAAGGRVDRSAMQDVARLRAFLAGPAVQALFDAPWLPLYLLVIFALHPLLGAAATASALLMFGLGLASERLVRGDAEQALAAGRRAGQRIDALARHAEVLLGMRMLAAALAHWGAAHEHALQAQQRAGDRAAALAATGRVLRQAVQVLMLGLGAWLVVAGHASPGIMVAATVLVARALQPVEHLVAGWKSLVEVRAAWQQLQLQPAAVRGDTSLQLPAPRGELSLERVSLAAEATRTPLIRNLSLALAPGECLGLVGPSGSGKTTLLRLMLGLRVPQAGTVRLDGVDLQAWPREQLAGAVGYLPQDVALFAASVAQNIARLGPVDSGRVLEAARLAGVHELVARLPQAYDTVVGEAGTALSGGHCQRIALARALYGLPRLVLLDEPNAHLDSEGEEALSAAIDALKRAGSTVVLVSHRPALMRHADRLAVLREGVLEAIGPRDAMLARLSGSTVQRLRPAAGPGPAALPATLPADFPAALPAQGAHA